MTTTTIEDRLRPVLSASYPDRSEQAGAVLDVLDAATSEAQLKRGIAYIIGHHCEYAQQGEPTVRSVVMPDGLWVRGIEAASKDMRRFSLDLTRRNPTLEEAAVAVHDRLIKGQKPGSARTMRWAQFLQIFCPYRQIPQHALDAAAAVNGKDLDDLFKELFTTGDLPEAVVAIVTLNRRAEEFSELEFLMAAQAIAATARTPEEGLVALIVAHEMNLKRKSMMIPAIIIGGLPGRS